MTQRPHMESIFAGQKIIIRHPVHPRLSAKPLVTQFFNLILIGYLFRIVVLQRREHNAERIIIMSQLEHIRIRHRCINNGMSSRTCILPYRLVKDREIRNPDLGIFQHALYRWRLKISDTIDSTEIDFPSLVLIECTVRKLVSLQTIARIIIDITAGFSIILADTHIGADPHIVLLVLTNSTDYISRQTIRHRKASKLISLLVEAI